MHCDVAPAVADRRVLHRLPARHLAAAPQAAARRSRSRTRRRRSRPTSSTTSCAGPTASASASSSTSSAPRVAGNGENLNDAIRRASPGAARDRQGPQDPRQPEPGPRRPRQERRHGHRRPRRQPARTSQRWVVEARDTAKASAERRADIAAGFQQAAGLPRAAAPDDGRARRRRRRADAGAAQAQAPTPTSSDASSTTSARSPTRRRPAFRALGEASADRRQGGQGRDARSSRSSNTFAKGTPELGQEPRDRPRAPRRPRPRGREGPALARAARATPASRRCSSTSTTRCMSVNIYDANRTSSRSRCGRRRLRGLRRHQAAPRKVGKRLRRRASGPNLAGINFEDTTAPPGGDADAVARRQEPPARRRPARRSRSPRPPRRCSCPAATPARPPPRRSRCPSRARPPSRSRTCPGREPARRSARPPTRGSRADRPAHQTRPSSTTCWGLRRRRPTASIVANPVLVGAVTTLVVIVAVFLAYNANNGLPFVPTRSLNVQIANGAELVPGQRGALRRLPHRRRRRHEAGAAAQRQGRRRAEAQARQEDRRGPGRLDGERSARARRSA